MVFVSRVTQSCPDATVAIAHDRFCLSASVIAGDFRNVDTGSKLPIWKSMTWVRPSAVVLL